MASGTKPALANAGQPSETAAMFLFFPLVEAVVKEVMESVGLFGSVLCFRIQPSHNSINH